MCFCAQMQHMSHYYKVLHGCGIRNLNVARKKCYNRPQRENIAISISYNFFKNRNFDLLTIIVTTLDMTHCLLKLE